MAGTGMNWALDAARKRSLSYRYGGSSGDPMLRPVSRFLPDRTQINRSYRLLRVTDAAHVVRAPRPAASRSGEDKGVYTVTLPRVRFLET